GGQEGAAGDAQTLSAPKSQPRVVDVAEGGPAPGEGGSAISSQSGPQPHREGTLGDLGHQHGRTQAGAAQSHGVVGAGVGRSLRCQVDPPEPTQEEGGGQAAERDPQDEAPDHGWVSSHDLPCGQKRANSQLRQAGDGIGSNSSAAIALVSWSTVVWASASHSSSTSVRAGSDPSPR